MKELTNEEKTLVGNLWDAGYGINAIVTAITNKRKDMDAYYLGRQVAEELNGKVSIGKEGGD